MGGFLERRWIETWAAAAPKLGLRKQRELQELTPEQARFFSDAVLSLPAGEALERRRGAGSGLTDLQELFQRLSRR
jgi:hypothetical protein